MKLAGLGTIVFLVLAVVGIIVALAIMRWSDSAVVRHWSGVGAVAGLFSLAFVAIALILGQFGLGLMQACAFSAAVVLLGWGVTWPYIERLAGYNPPAAREAGTQSQYSRFATELLGFYSQGVALRSALVKMNVSDAEIERSEKDIDTWYSEALQWIQHNMGQAAAMRFTDNSDKFARAFQMAGQHAPKYIQMRDNLLNGLSGCLQNLQTIANTTLYDPK